MASQHRHVYRSASRRDYLVLLIRTLPVKIVVCDARFLSDVAAEEVIGVLDAMFYTLVPNKGGRVELVAAAIPQGGGRPQAIWYAGRNADGEWPKGDWDSLGKPDDLLALRRWPAVAANHDGRLEVVVVGSVFWNNWQHPSGAWVGWHSLEKPPVDAWTIGSSALARNEDGRLELFTKTQDGTLWHRWQSERGAGPWREWHSLGKPGGQKFGVLDIPPTVVSNTGGRLELFVLGDDSNVWHCWQTVPNGGWSSWSPLEAPNNELTGDPAVVRNKDGRLELFAAGGGIWHRRQAEPGQGPWEAWYPLGGVGQTSSFGAAVGAHADGRLVVFTLAITADGDREVWQLEQTPPNDEWSEWKSFGRPAKMHPGEPISSLANIVFPSLVSDGQGRLVLMSAAPGLVNGTSTMFFCLRQRAPSGAEWSSGLQFFGVPPGSSQ